MYFVPMPLWLFIAVLPFVIWAAPPEDRGAVIGGATLLIGLPLLWRWAKGHLDADAPERARRRIERRMTPDERQQRVRANRILDLMAQGHTLDEATEVVDGTGKRPDVSSTTPVPATLPVRADVFPVEPAEDVLAAAAGSSSGPKSRMSWGALAASTAAVVALFAVALALSGSGDDSGSADAMSTEEVIALESQYDNLCQLEASKWPALADTKESRETYAEEMANDHAADDPALWTAVYNGCNRGLYTYALRSGEVDWRTGS